MGKYIQVWSFTGLIWTYSHNLSFKSGTSSAVRFQNPSEKKAINYSEQNPYLAGFRYVFKTNKKKTIKTIRSDHLADN